MIVKYFAWLKNITNTEEEIINDDSIKDIKSLKNFIIKKYPKMDKYINEDEVVKVAINFEHTKENKKISDSDEIAFFPPVSGG